MDARGLVSGLVISCVSALGICFFFAVEKSPDPLATLTLMKVLCMFVMVIGGLILVIFQSEYAALFLGLMCCLTGFLWLGGTFLTHPDLMKSPQRTEKCVRLCPNEKNGPSDVSTLNDNCLNPEN